MRYSNGTCYPALDCGNDFGIRQGSRIALFLQFELTVIDAARHIRDQHEGDIDGLRSVRRVSPDKRIAGSNQRSSRMLVASPDSCERSRYWAARTAISQRKSVASW